MTTLSIQERLAARALNLKKAWIIAAMMIGHVPRDGDETIPAYDSWSQTRLQGHIPDLEADICDALKSVLLSPALALSEEAVSWMAAQFDRWQREGFGLLNLSSALEFERLVAPLDDRGVLDIPPYAEMLLQPGIEVAFRHPEYMLARDLDCLHSLYLDAEALLAKVDWTRPPAWAAGASENAQGLGRLTILTCFNLLESFTSGLAKAHCMLHPELDEQVRARLLSTQEPLRKRFLAVPRQILGFEPPLDLNKPPLSALFGTIKAYRDSFVHCEPGDQVSVFGHVKQALFHDVSPQLVVEALSLTETAIRELWFAIHSRPGPRWLAARDDDGRTRRHNLTVAPPNTVGGPPGTAGH